MLEAGAKDNLKMKKFLNAKIPLWVIGAILLVVAFLAVAGFRITYAPELENSWSAISAVATWAGVAATTVAIIVAIQIPQRIADNENKIALFDKRYEVYDAITRCITFSDLIIAFGGEKLSTKELQELFISSFKGTTLFFSQEEPSKAMIKSSVLNVVTVLGKGELLFGKDIQNELSALGMAL